MGCWRGCNGASWGAKCSFRVAGQPGGTPISPARRSIRASADFASFQNPFWLNGRLWVQIQLPVCKRRSMSALTRDEECRSWSSQRMSSFPSREGLRTDSRAIGIDCATTMCYHPPAFQLCTRPRLCKQRREACARSIVPGFRNQAQLSCRSFTFSHAPAGGHESVETRLEHGYWTRKPCQ